MKELEYLTSCLSFEVQKALMRECTALIIQRAWKRYYSNKNKKLLYGYAQAYNFLMRIERYDT